VLRKKEPLYFKYNFGKDALIFTISAINIFSYLPFNGTTLQLLTTSKLDDCSTKMRTDLLTKMYSKDFCHIC